MIDQPDDYRAEDQQRTGRHPKYPSHPPYLLLLLIEPFVDFGSMLVDLFRQRIDRILQAAGTFL